MVRNKNEKCFKISCLNVQSLIVKIIQFIITSTNNYFKIVFTPLKTIMARAGITNLTTYCY